MMGQSNMIGYGRISAGTVGRVGTGIEGYLDYAIQTKGKYPYLVDAAGAWTERKDVRFVHVQGSGTGATTLYKNQWLKVIDKASSTAYHGVELGIGHFLGHALDAPILLIKSCIGHRALGWDLLPPGSVEYQHAEPPDSNGLVRTWAYPGFGGTPERWEWGTTPTPITWTAGVQYTGDTNRAIDVLRRLDTYYPGATRYTVAGFFWWQGNRDLKYEGHAIRYEQNLVRLIQELRRTFDAPNAKFVCATLGETATGATGTQRMVFDAQMAISNKAQYPEFDGQVATVYSHPLSMGGSSGSHYDSHAETYMNVGEAMGQAMADLAAANFVGYDRWLASHSLVDEGFNGDDDNDQLPNGVECLFGTSPETADAGITQVGKAGNAVTFAHPNPAPADVPLDVDGAYQWSLNLTDWYAADGVDGPGGTVVTATAIPDSPSSGVTTVTATVAGPASDQLYLRIVATRP